MSPQPMSVVPRFIQICGKVQKSYASFHGHPVPVVPDDWKSAVEKSLSTTKSYPITFEWFKPQGDIIKGTLVRSTGSAKIWISEKETVCWQRFIALKELSHLLIDEPNQYTTKPTNLMGQLIQSVPIWAIKRDADQSEEAFLSEKLAVMSAMEMILPWKHRGVVTEMFTRGKDNLEIAKHFKAPQNMVSNLLSITYSGLSTYCNINCR